MSSLAGVYWSVMHRPMPHYDFLMSLQPTVLKIMDGGVPDYAWAYHALPNTLIIARDHPLSEQHGDMLRDPVGTGVRHANEWNAHAARLNLDRSRTLVLGINEPRVWEAGVPEALRQYTIAFCDECARFGLRAGAMQLSVGWPANRGAGQPPDWSPWHGVEDAIRRGNHALILHEYWADLGPGENWGWWAGRALQCPWNVPIVIGECGVDMYVKRADIPHQLRGWAAHMRPERYADELREYTERMAADGRFVGGAVFALDFANNEWASFDIDRARDAILALPPVEPPARLDVYLPIVGGPPVSHEDYFPRVMQFVARWEGGYVNHPLDKGGPTNMGITLATLARWRGRDVTAEDVQALTREEANEIYRAYYWGPSGAADAGDYATALLLMDSGVLHGVGAPQAWVREYGHDAWRIAARRLRVYTSKSAESRQWEAFGRGWVNRVADLLVEMGKA